MEKTFKKIHVVKSKERLINKEIESYLNKGMVLYKELESSNGWYYYFKKKH